MNELSSEEIAQKKIDSINRPVISRYRLEMLRGQLSTERSTFLSHWNDLGRFILPRRPRFFTTDGDRGNRRNNSIVDSTAGLAARTLRSGMMSGITSPARPWFRLSTANADLDEKDDVKEWLYDVTTRMSDIFLRSNVYNALPTVYGDMSIFGTAAVLIEEDYEQVIRAYPFAIGSYYLITDQRGKVNGFMRDFRMTVRQIVEKFGMTNGSNTIVWDNISPLVRDQWNNGNTEQWMEMSHAILPNPDWDPRRHASKFKKYRSCYWERGTTANQMNISESYDKLLSDRGYDSFRVLAPRWEVTGEDIYGTYCPGMEALGDIMQLQMMERRGMQALEKSINPPMVGPSSLRTQKSSILPGDITYLDVREGTQSFAPAYQISPNFDQLEKKEIQIRQRISKAMFEDLFLMLSESDRREITAREIDERHEEKLLALGPVLEQLNQDLLDPLVEITFETMVKQGLVPPAPPELHGVPLRVIYTSIMAQAQKLLGIAGLERFSGFVGNVRTTTEDPAVLDKVDMDTLIDKYGEMTGIPPGIVRDQDKVDAIRQQRQQQQQAQAQAEQAAQAADAAKKLSGADMTGDNALTRLAAAGQAGNVLPQQ